MDKDDREELAVKVFTEKLDEMANSDTSYYNLPRELGELMARKWLARSMMYNPPYFLTGSNGGRIEGIKNIIALKNLWGSLDLTEEQRSSRFVMCKSIPEWNRCDVPMVVKKGSKSAAIYIPISRFYDREESKWNVKFMKKNVFLEFQVQMSFKRKTRKKKGSKRRQRVTIETKKNRKKVCGDRNGCGTKV